MVEAYIRLCVDDGGIMKPAHWVLVVLGMVVLAGALLEFLTRPSSSFDTHSASPSMPPRVLSTVLFKAYDDNAIAADATYRAPLIIEGRIKDIGKDITGAPYLVLGDNPNAAQGVQAFFADASDLVSVSKGQFVHVNCARNDGFLVRNVIVRGCVMIR